MKLSSITLALVITLSWTTVHAGFWKDSNGKPVPETEYRRTVEDFAGWLVVTSDQDWEAKWNTPPETVPQFTEAKSVGRGKKIFVLIFFANPKLDGEKRANITCDLKATRPDGTTSIDHQAAVCFQGHIKGSPYNMYLAAPVIGFVGEPSDPTGVWTIQTVLKDNLRKVVVPLKTTFTLE